MDIVPPPKLRPQHFLWMTLFCPKQTNSTIYFLVTFHIQIEFFLATFAAHQTAQKTVGSTGGGGGSSSSTVSATVARQNGGGAVESKPPSTASSRGSRAESAAGRRRSSGGSGGTATGGSVRPHGGATGSVRPKEAGGGAGSKLPQPTRCVDNIGSYPIWSDQIRSDLILSDLGGGRRRRQQIATSNKVCG